MVSACFRLPTGDSRPALAGGVTFKNIRQAEKGYFSHCAYLRQNSKKSEKQKKTMTRSMGCGRGSSDSDWGLGGWGGLGDYTPDTDHEL